jgi:hypothetical protein
MIKLRKLTNEDWNKIPVGTELKYKKKTTFIVTNNKSLRSPKCRAFGGYLISNNKKTQCSVGLDKLYIQK